MSQFWIYLILASASLATEMKLACLNVNFENDRIKETITAIVACDPDVILLQETTPRFEQEAGKHLPPSYKYAWYVHGPPKSAAGFGVISKYPIQAQRLLPKDKGSFGAQQFEVTVNKTAVNITNVHLSPSALPASGNRGTALHAMMLNNKIQSVEINEILKETKLGKATIIAGDLNSFPSMAAYKILTRRSKYVDAHLSIDPKANSKPTWRHSQNGDAFQGRFDYVFHSAKIKTRGFRLLAVPYSDHSLLSCTLELHQ